MASKLGPLFALLATAKKDWTSTLLNPEAQVVIQTAQGKAYALDVPSDSFKKSLFASSEPQWIFLGQVIREDEEILYGFENPRERTLFEELRSIDGIGPKSAALLVGRIGLKGFRDILENPKNISTVKVPGLGPKNMEKLSLGLKQKKEHFMGILGTVQNTSSSVESDNFDSERPDLEKALTQLGLKPFESKALLASMCKEDESYLQMPLTQLLQEALKWWGRSRSRGAETNV